MIYYNFKKRNKIRKTSCGWFVVAVHPKVGFSLIRASALVFPILYSCVSHTASSTPTNPNNRSSDIGGQGGMVGAGGRFVSRRRCFCCSAQPRRLLLTPLMHTLSPELCPISILLKRLSPYPANEQTTPYLTGCSINAIFPHFSPLRVFFFTSFFFPA